MDSGQEPDHGVCHQETCTGGTRRCSSRTGCYGELCAPTEEDRSTTRHVSDRCSTPRWAPNRRLTMERGVGRPPLEVDGGTGRYSSPDRLLR